MMGFPAIPTMNGWLPFFSPTCVQVRKEQRPEQQKLTLSFWAVTFHREASQLGTAGHQLAKDSLSWINCKRERNPRNAFPILWEKVPEWGEGPPAVQGWPERLLPSTGSSQYLCLKPQQGNRPPPVNPPLQWKQLLTSRFGKKKKKKANSFPVVSLLPR